MEAKRLSRQRYAAALRVTKGGDRQAIIELLDSPDPDVRSHAAHVIARQRLSEAVPELVRRVSEEEDSSVRNSIVLALADFRAPEARDVLLSLLTDESENVRRIALRALSRLGDESVIDTALATYPAGATFAKYEALGALVELHTDASRAALQHLLDVEKSWWWRYSIRKALRRHKRQP